MQHVIGGISVLLLCLSSFSLKADNMLQLSAGFSVWNSSPEGSFGESAETVLLLDKTSASQLSYYFKVEHHFPLVPNIKVSKTTVSNKATTTLDKTFVLNGSIFRVASDLDVISDYDQLDLTTYLEVFDNRTLELDLGITFRTHSINNTVTNQYTIIESAAQESTELKLFAFTAGRINLPLLNLGAFAETNFLDSDNYGIEAGIRYEFSPITLAKTYFKIGVKKQQIEFSNLDGLYIQSGWQELFVGVDVYF